MQIIGKVRENRKMPLYILTFKPKIKLTKNWFAGRVKTFQKNFSRRTTSSKIYLNFYFKITDQNYCKVVKAYEILLKVPITLHQQRSFSKLKVIKNYLWSCIWVFFFVVIVTIFFFPFIFISWRLFTLQYLERS